MRELPGEMIPTYRRYPYTTAAKVDSVENRMQRDCRTSLKRFCLEAL